MRYFNFNSVFNVEKNAIGRDGNRQVSIKPLGNVGFGKCRVHGGSGGTFLDFDISLKSKSTKLTSVFHSEQINTQLITPQIHSCSSLSGHMESK